MDEVDECQLTKLGSALAHALCCASEIPKVDVVCFGRRTQPEWVPEPLRRVLTMGIGLAAWLPDIEIAIILLNNQVPFRRLLIHELTHALLNLLTGGFSFPLAIQEGYARLMEYHIRGSPKDLEREEVLSDIGTGENGYLSSNECISIRDLLAFDSSPYVTGESAPVFRNLTRASFWMITYFAKIRSRRTLGSDSILAELWKRGLSTPLGTYQFLADMHGISLDELESGFYNYCICGRL